MRLRPRVPAAPLLLCAWILPTMVAPARAEAACSTTRVTSLAALAAEMRTGRSACLADGSYSGGVELTNLTRTRATVTQEGAAVIRGQVRLSSSHLALDGLRIRNRDGSGSEADCIRIQTVGGTDLAITDSDIGACARDAIRMAYNRGRHDVAITIARNTLHDASRNACTCYMRDSRFVDNLVHDIHNDGLDLWGSGNVVSRNTFRDLVASPAANHNDVLQTWQIPDDPATGDPLSGLVFERNVIDTVTGPDSHAVMIEGSANHGLTIRSNLIRDVGSIAMLFDGAADVELLANTFVRAGGLDTLEWKGGASGSISSNVLYQAASAGPQPWYQDPGSHPSHAYNLAWAGKLLSDELTGINADPRFHDPDGTRNAIRVDDYSLEEDSPAVDRGDPSVTTRTDLLGNPISGFRLDIGAFERPGA